MLVAQDKPLRQKYAPSCRIWRTCISSSRCWKARNARGAMDFELPETKILFNAQRKIERIVPLSATMRTS